MSRVWYDADKGMTEGSSLGRDLSSYQFEADPAPPHHFSGVFDELTSTSDSGYLDAVTDAVSDLIVLGGSLKVAMEGMQDVMTAADGQ